MKRKILLSLLILIILTVQNILYSQINQDWKWVHPMPQGNTLSWVKVFSPVNWIAIGDNGTFIKTTNAGTTWDIFANAGGIYSATNQSRTLYDGWFFDASTGLVCGSYGWMGRTTNGGTSWDSIGVPVSAAITLDGIQFINSTTGFVKGNSTIFKTINAGLNWITLSSAPSAIRCFIAIDENNIFGASQNNFVKTTNGGINWISYSIAMSIPYDIIFFNVNTGFIGGDIGNVIRTTNGGVNWVSKPPPGSAVVCFKKIIVPYGFTFSEDFNGTAFPPPGWRAVNVLGNSIFWVRSTTGPHSPPSSALILNDCNFSTGGGLDWLITPQIQINTGDTLSFWMKPLFTSFTDSLCVKVSTTDTALSSFTTRVLYLADGAGYPSSSAWTNYKVSLNSFSGQNIYIGFKHQDFCGDGLFLDDVAIMSPSLITEKLYAVGDKTNIYSTTDSGNNWTTISILEPSQNYTSFWNSIDVSGSSIVICGDKGILNASTNDGANWTAYNNRIANGYFYDAWCSNGTGKVWVVGSLSPGETKYDQVLYSSNGGNTFQIQNVNGSKASYRSICMLNDNTGFICGSNGAIRKTTNCGLTWDTLVTYIPDNMVLYKIDFVNLNTGWVFSNTTNSGGTIWKTINGGMNWVQQSLSDTIPNGNIVNTADMINENLGYCVNVFSAIHMTTNGGINWIAKTPRICPGLINEIKMVSANEGYVCSTGKLLRTTNQWQNYDSIPVPVTTTFNATKWLDMNNGFMASNFGFVLRTTNGGAEWEIMQTSVPYLYNICVKAIDTAYAVGSSGNIVKLGKGAIGIITWKNKLPAQFYLGQNYPNPFNPITEFKFGLFSKGKVNLKVYDITGRLVHTYFDNMELNAGTVTVKFDGSNLASGVYFYTLFVDDNRIDTKKMILIK